MKELNAVNLEFCQVLGQTVLQYKEISSIAPLYSSNKDEVICLQVAYDGEAQNLVKRIDELLEDKFYLEFINNFLTLPQMAEHYNIHIEVAVLFHKLGKQWHEAKHGKPLNIEERMKQSTFNTGDKAIIVYLDITTALIGEYAEVTVLNVEGKDIFVVGENNQKAWVTQYHLEKLDNTPIAVMPPKYKVDKINNNGRERYVVYPFVYTKQNVPLCECVIIDTKEELEIFMGV